MPTYTKIIEATGELSGYFITGGDIETLSDAEIRARFNIGAGMTYLPGRLDMVNRYLESGHLEQRLPIPEGVLPDFFTVGHSYQFNIPNRTRVLVDGVEQTEDPFTIAPVEEGEVEIRVRGKFYGDRIIPVLDYLESRRRSYLPPERQLQILHEEGQAAWKAAMNAVDAQFPAP